jgi:GNAT superfamily N-acetyltransferase
MPVCVRPASPADDVAGWVARSWGAPAIAVHGTVYDVTRLPALVAASEGTLVGVLTYFIANEALEVVSCDAAPPGRGTGRALVRAAIDLAADQRLSRVWCTTTNDNLPALGFWQALGFALTALRPDAVAAARAVKPALPWHGYRGLPIRDELDLTYPLAGPDTLPCDRPV